MLVEIFNRLENIEFPMESNKVLSVLVSSIFLFLVILSSRLDILVSIAAALVL